MYTPPLKSLLANPEPSICIAFCAGERLITCEYISFSFCEIIKRTPEICSLEYIWTQKQSTLRTKEEVCNKICFFLSMEQRGSSISCLFPFGNKTITT